jgi:hypothetical protein
LPGLTFFQGDAPGKLADSRLLSENLLLQAFLFG